MKIPHPIPYQGSKRNLANDILQFFPNKVERLVEPFAGSAAISVASAFYFKTDKFWLNDVNAPLIALWKMIINKPEELIRQYQHVWLAQLGNEEAHYYEIRDLFNQNQRPVHLLFLLAKCVKAAVRYNSNGGFNQSPDKRRKGRRPENMRKDILRVSKLLKGKTAFSALHYEEVLDSVHKNDLVYLDPPYQGTGKNGGFRYFKDVHFDDFVLALFALNQKKVPFIISYDGRTGTKKFGKTLPDELNLLKIELNAGRSSLATLHNRKVTTFESLYLSENLLNKIDVAKILKPISSFQPTLFD